LQADSRVQVLVATSSSSPVPTPGMYLFYSHYSYFGYNTKTVVFSTHNLLQFQALTSMAIMMKLHKLISQKKVLYYYREIHG
jgi:hypothetical protein